MNFKKITSLALMAIMVTTSVIGCGKKEDNSSGGGGNKEKTVLTVYIPGYGDAVYKDAYDQGINKFKESNKDIDIKVLPVSWEDSTTKMISMIKAGNAPDVMITGSQRLKPLIKMDAIEVLDSYVKDEKKDKYIQELYNTGKVDGKQYGLPMAFSSRALYYRSDLIPNPPKTWEEIIEISKKIEKENPGMKGYAVTGELKGSVETQLGNFLVQNGASYYDENGKPSLDTPEALEAFKFYTDLYVKENVVPNPVDVNRNDLSDLFKNGKVAMFVDGPWAKGLMGIEENDSKTPFSVAELPKGKQMGEILVTDSFVISSNSKHKEESYKFIEFMTQLENQNYYDSKVGFFPLLKEEMKEERYATDFYKPFTNMIQYGKSAPIPATFEEFEDIIAKAVQKTVLKEMSAEDALKEAQEALIELENK